MTITATASIGAPSSTVETVGAMDYDVTLYIGEEEVDGEITLIPDGQTGELGSWGEPAHWISGALLARMSQLDAGQFRIACDALIAAAAEAGESEEER